ncbi:MAG: response regulator [Candidatus Omnitrophica bacterium]|nr:response regulator [Candidatus Omnitrophota bacterium]
MPKVLVVDDDVKMREALYDALTRKGHAVSTAGTGGQALEMLKAQRPQLVLLDVALPGLSGLETAARIREFDSEVPIILLEDSEQKTVSPAELQRLAIVGVVSHAWGAGRILDRVEPLLARHPGGSSAEPAGIGGTLLVVDDDVQIQELLKTFFQSKGLRVLVAGSGEEGLKALAKRPALVLLDVNMPGMDGVMALKKIKAAHPALPVVMISGGGEEVMARGALAAGAYDYVSKPFSLEYLETIVLSKVLLGMETD